MNNLEKKAQTFLYFGILMLLIAVDWRWYAQRYPDESFLLQLPFVQLIYALWLAAVAVCFGASILLFWKVRKEQRRQQHRHRRQKG